MSNKELLLQDAWPALFTAEQAARFLGIGTSTFWRHYSSGKIPAPLRLGGRTLWRVEELQAWVANGCPPVDHWHCHRANRWTATAGQRHARVL